MITVPATFEADVVRHEGDAGRRWLASLPAQVALLLQGMGPEH